MPSPLLHNWRSFGETCGISKGTNNRPASQRAQTSSRQAMLATVRCRVLAAVHWVGSEGRGPLVEAVLVAAKVAEKAWVATMVATGVAVKEAVERMEVAVAMEVMEA